MAESPFAAAVREARGRAATDGRELIDLTVSNPTLCGFSYEADMILAPLASAGGLRYDPDPRGTRPAREAVARYYRDHGALIDADALVLTTSTSEAYGYLFRLLCDGGDEVLVPQPSYPLFDFLADLHDVRLRPYPLFYDFGWWIDFAALEQQIGPRTKAILIVHPNNPTGHWTSRAERARLVALCDRYRLALIVDEVFLDYPLTMSEESSSFATGDSSVLTFILSGMSKIAALPQMKAAWVLTVGPDALQKEALGRLEVIADTFLSMSAPVQQALPTWLRQRHAMQEQVRARIGANLQMAASLLDVLRSEAGWSAVVRTVVLAEALLAEQAVIVHPGAFYGIAARHRVVVSLLPPESVFAEGVRRMVALAEGGEGPAG